MCVFVYVFSFAAPPFFTSPTLSHRLIETLEVLPVLVQLSIQRLVVILNKLASPVHGRQLIMLFLKQKTKKKKGSHHQ